MENAADDGTKHDMLLFLGVYFGIVLSAAVTTYARQMGVLSMSVRASENLHDELFNTVLLCPLSFFDTTSVSIRIFVYHSNFLTLCAPASLVPCSV